MRYNIKPFPAVRSNWKWWRFTPRAKEYHNKMNELRALIEAWEFTKEEMMLALINWVYRLEFIFEIPKTWSKKQKELKGQVNWKPHRQSPDIDNLFKAFTDTLFYWQDKFNDREIYKLNAYKYWGNEWEINFYIT